jgi:hypothetical protein
VTHVYPISGAMVLTSPPIGSGEIWLDEVACSGIETRLTDCFSSPLGSNDCTHLDDAGVICRPGKESCSVTRAVQFHQIVSHSMPLTVDLLIAGILVAYFSNFQGSTN